MRNGSMEVNPGVLALRHLPVLRNLIVGTLEVDLCWGMTGLRSHRDGGLGYLRTSISSFRD